MGNNIAENTTRFAVAALAAAAAFGGCAFASAPRMREVAGAPEYRSEWIAASAAPVADAATRRSQLSAPGTSWFASTFANPRAVKRAEWTVSGLGVFEAYVNGRRIGGEHALKPGFTHGRKTKYCFTYDVTDALRRGKGERNTLAAEVSAGWWRDKIVTPAKHRGFIGKKSAFRGSLELVYSDGRRETIDTDAEKGTVTVSSSLPLLSLI